MSNTRNQINDYLKEINVDGKTVLDVGAGRPRAWIFPPEGNQKVQGTPKDYKTADIDTAWGCDYEIDLNDGLDAFAYLPRANDGLDAFAYLPRADVVFCMETLEHVWNPIGAIQLLARSAKETLYLSVPFIYPIHDLHDYLRYTFQWFEKVLPMYGFKNVEVVARTSENVHEFHKGEGARMSKVTIKKGWGHHIHDVGYLIKATK